MAYPAHTVFSKRRWAGWMGAYNVKLFLREPIIFDAFAKVAVRKDSQKTFHPTWTRVIVDNVFTKRKNTPHRIRMGQSARALPILPARPPLQLIVHQQGGQSPIGNPMPTSFRRGRSPADAPSFARRICGRYRSMSHHVTTLHYEEYSLKNLKAILLKA
jgi:hypothetical protein